MGKKKNLAGESAGPDRRGELCEIVPPGHYGGRLCVGQGLQVLRDHGDHGGLRGQPDQGHQEARRGAAAAHRRRQVNRRNGPRGEVRGGRGQDQEGHRLRRISLPVGRGGEQPVYILPSISPPIGRLRCPDKKSTASGCEMVRE